MTGEWQRRPAQTQAQRNANPELRLCRRYGCRHEARDHGFVDGIPTCWRCLNERSKHGFQVR